MVSWAGFLQVPHQRTGRSYPPRLLHKAFWCLKSFCIPLEAIRCLQAVGTSVYASFKDCLLLVDAVPEGSDAREAPGPVVGRPFLKNFSTKLYLSLHDADAIAHKFLRLQHFLADLFTSFLSQHVELLDD